MRGRIVRVQHFFVLREQWRRPLDCLPRAACWTAGIGSTSNCFVPESAGADVQPNIGADQETTAATSLHKRSGYSAFVAMPSSTKRECATCHKNAQRKGQGASYSTTWSVCPTYFRMQTPASKLRNPWKARQGGRIRQEAHVRLAWDFHDEKEAAHVRTSRNLCCGPSQGFSFG